jgi:16S rRNA (guanine966-N2)-methyltransferase
MRIVAGRFAGHDLTSPEDQRVRPTAEEVRAALLDRLAWDVQGARVLDLFAGSGALGLEAISRGAKSCDFVEFRPSSLHALKANVVALRLKAVTRVFAKDALPFMRALPPRSYDVVFADPPYTSRLADRVLAAWRENRFAAVLVLEHAASHDLPAGAGRLVMGDTRVTIYRF